MFLPRLRISFLSLAVGVAGVVAFAPRAEAISIEVQNYSFELNPPAQNGVVTSVPVGWSFYNRSGGTDFGYEWAKNNQYIPNTPLASPAQGNLFAYVNKFEGQGTGGIFQDVGALQANTLYTLTVAIGSRSDRINSPGIISLYNGTNELGNLLGSTSGLPATQGTWQDYTVTFTTGATVSGNLTIGLSVAGANTIQANFDNVRLTAVAVPEPSTYGMAFAAVLGGAILLRVRRRRIEG